MQWTCSCLSRNIEMWFLSSLSLKVKPFKVLLECQVKPVMIVNQSIGFFHQEWVIEHFPASFLSIGFLGIDILLLVLYSIDFFFSFSRRSLPFNQTLHLINSWNENKPVKIGRDGQVNLVQLICWTSNRTMFSFALRISNHVVLNRYVVYFQLIQPLIWYLFRKKPINIVHRVRLHQVRWIVIGQMWLFRLRRRRLIYF